MLSAQDAAGRKDSSRANIVKRIKIGGRWKMFSIPRNARATTTGTPSPTAYDVEWYVGGTRRRVSAGVTAAQALEVQRRKHHELEGRKLGIPGFEQRARLSRNLRCTSPSQNTWSRSTR